MFENKIQRLKNIIAMQRFVNCYSRKFSPEDRQVLDGFLAKLKNAYVNICVDVDIRGFENCETGEQEATVLLDIINRELTGKGREPVQFQALSISDALIKWSKNLGWRVLLVFHCFSDLYSETEIKILQALRKAITPSPEKKDQLTSYLSILIIGNRKVSDWELYPYSPIDDRHVTFVELESMEGS